tara:strand:+ start:85 stop:504 length:420 start_codon:yes stop_codon:yes gene_type:complete
MGRVLGLDYGDSRIGLALSDPLKMIASPLKTISNKSSEFIKKNLSDLIIENDIELIVVSLPISLKGKETKQTKKVKLFIKQINCFTIPIFTQDERLSSISAKKSLMIQKIKTGHNKQLIDSTAAAIFLQQFLDIRKKNV